MKHTYTRKDKEYFTDLIERQALSPSPNSFSDEADPGPESRLLSKCTRFLKRHNFKYIHDYSRGDNEAGILDLYIFMPKARLVVIELKAKTGRLRKEQKEWIKYLGYHGYEVYPKVKSYKRFLEIIHKEDT